MQILKSDINVIALSALSDNYIWILASNKMNGIYVVDPGDSRPVLNWLNNFYESQLGQKSLSYNLNSADTWSNLAADDNWWRHISHQYADSCQANSGNGYFNYLNDVGAARACSYWRISCREKRRVESWP